MGKFLGFLVVACVATAGCAGAGGESSTSAVGSSTTNAAASANHTKAPLNATTDTLHFLEVPTLGLAAGNHTVIIPKGAPYQAQTFTWNATLHHEAVVTGADFHVWLRITGSQAQAGAQDPGCTALATIYITHNGTQRGINGGCGSLGIGVVAPGDRDLHFSAPPDAFVTPAAVSPGDDVLIQLTLYLESPGLAITCYILGGPAFDSTLTLIGLNETVPATTPMT